MYIWSKQRWTYAAFFHEDRKKTFETLMTEANCENLQTTNAIRK